MSWRVGWGWGGDEVKEGVMKEEEDGAGAIIQFTSERVDGHIKKTEDVQDIKTSK